jgi:hypothetical protein
MTQQWAAGEGQASDPTYPAAMEPQPEPELLPSSGASHKGWIAGAVIGAILLAGVGYSSGLFTSDPAAAPPSATATSAAPAVSQGFSLLQPVTPAEQGAALQDLVMNDADKGAATKAVQSGAARLAWLAFSDSGTEDGDIVSITGAGFNQTVPLLKKQTRLAVPYMPGAPIKVFAKKDGFAPGVTVAVYVGGSVFKLKTMKEGEMIEIAAP